MVTLPHQLEKYFWDTDPKTLNPGTHQGYIIGRLLHLGDDLAWKWLTQSYSTEQLINVIKTNREMSAKDAHFFSVYYHLPLESLRCTQPALINRH